MESADEQQFCLRWNNFQANITSQFETLRDDEDFTDVTIACDGQRLQAHKVVLSACSPYFKELFKTNPCSHPIIFMRDVEARHVVALMEFMYAGEVNVAQAHLSAFLRTAESLKIRGLTDTNPDFNQRDDDALFLNPQPSSSKTNAAKDQVNLKNRKNQNSAACSSAVTSSQDIGNDQKGPSSPPPKRQCKQEPEVQPSQLENAALQRLRQIDESISINPFALNDNLQESDIEPKKAVQPKIELPDYLSDDDGANYFPSSNDLAALTGGMEIIPQNITSNKESALDHSIGRMLLENRRRSESWSPFEMRNQSTSPDLISRLRECREKREKDEDGKNRLVKLGEGIEIHEDQLRSVKWSDYRKLTRGLATILFSPAELATCSVTGQRWSRAGSGERPVKPALDRAKVQAIISYVATRFPMVEISRIKQVLAYKCKENSTAFKMKAVRYYGDHIREPDRN